MIHAYDEIYLDSAMRILGDMLDFAINEIGMDESTFMERFLVSPASRNFARGNTRYVAGITGCELAREILESTGYAHPFPNDVMYVDKSPEFWAGWILAFYQWYRNLTFWYILEAISFNEIIAVYPLYHEMDPMKAVHFFDERLKTFHTKTRLSVKRENIGMSIATLAKNSGVSVQLLEHFEQDRNAINQASGNILLRLAKTFHCQIEDILEPDFT